MLLMYLKKCGRQCLAIAEVNLPGESHQTIYFCIYVNIFYTSKSLSMVYAADRDSLNLIDIFANYILKIYPGRPDSSVGSAIGF